MNKLFTVIDNRRTKYMLFTHSESLAYRCAKKNEDCYISEFEMNVEPAEHKLYLDVEEFRRKYL